MGERGRKRIPRPCCYRCGREMPDQTMYNWRRIHNKPLTDPYLCQQCESAEKQARNDALEAKQKAAKAAREEKHRAEKRRQAGRKRTVFGATVSGVLDTSFEICVVCGVRVYAQKYDWTPSKICKPCRDDIQEERSPPPVGVAGFRKSPEWSSTAIGLLPAADDSPRTPLPEVAGVLTQMANTGDGNEVWCIRCEGDSDRTMGAFRSRDNALAAAARNNIKITSVEEYREWWRR